MVAAGSSPFRADGLPGAPRNPRGSCPFRTGRKSSTGLGAPGGCWPRKRGCVLASVRPSVKAVSLGSEPSVLPTAPISRGPSETACHCASRRPGASPARLHAAAGQSLKPKWSWARGSNPHECALPVLHRVSCTPSLTERNGTIRGPANGRPPACPREGKLGYQIRRSAPEGKSRPTPISPALTSQ